MRRNVNVPKGAAPRQAIGVRLLPETVKTIDRLAAERGIGRAELIERLVARAVAAPVVVQVDK